MLTHQPRSIVALGATLVLAIASTLIAQPARAGPVDRRGTAAYGDLDLTRPEGVRTLKIRISRAVERVCGPDQRVEIAERQAYRACQAKARADALAQMQRAEAAARHQRGLTTASR